MKNKLFKWIPKEYLSNDPILWAITEEYVQSEAEASIGRTLTKKELSNFVDVLYDDDEIDYMRIEIIREAVLKVVDGVDTWI